MSIKYHGYTKFSDLERTMIAAEARAYFWRIGLAFGIDFDLS